MSAAEKIAFAREWYAKGTCPGCGIDLRLVAGNGGYHGPGGYFAQPSHCQWSGDDLTSLVLIGSGLVSC